MSKEVWSLVQNLVTCTVGVVIAAQFVGAHAALVVVGCEAGTAIVWACIGGLYKKASA